MRYNRYMGAYLPSYHIYIWSIFFLSPMGLHFHYRPHHLSASHDSLHIFRSLYPSPNLTCLQDEVVQESII